MGLILTNKEGKTVEIEDKGFNYSEEAKEIIKTQSKKFYRKGKNVVTDFKLDENGCLVLEPNMFLHFSVFVPSAPKKVFEKGEGLKAGIFTDTGIKQAQAKGETHSVVDCWGVLKEVKYTEIIKNLPTNGLGKYYPEYLLQDFGELEKQRLLDLVDMSESKFKHLSEEEQTKYLWLFSVGFNFIIDGRNQDFIESTKEVLHNESRKLFTGDATSITEQKYVSENGEVEFNHSGFVYGIPNRFISGIVLPYGCLMFTLYLKQMFRYLKDKTIIAPDGKVLYQPQNEEKYESAFKRFFKSRNDYIKTLKEEIKNQLEGNITY